MSATTHRHRDCGRADPGFSSTLPTTGRMIRTGKPPVVTRARGERAHIIGVVGVLCVFYLGPEEGTITGPHVDYLRISSATVTVCIGTVGNFNYEDEPQPAE
jgi:hypothetical protein